MVQIIDENKRPSFAQSVMGGLAQGGIQAFQQYQARQQQQQQLQQENQAIKQQFGVDLSGINNPELRKQAVIDALQGKSAEKKFDMERTADSQKAMDKFNAEQSLAADKFDRDRMTQAQESSDKFNQAQELQAQKYGYEKELEDLKSGAKNEEKNAPFQSGLKTIGAMRNIIKKGNLGLISKGVGLLSSKTRQDRAKYSQLGKSLISLASNIPIRNQREFETLAHDLYNPSNTDATNEGILDAMEAIIKQNLSGQGSPEDQFPGVGQSQERPPLSSFHR